MKACLLLVVLGLPALAAAEMWRWADSAGRMVYSNVPEHIPRGAREVRTDVGYLGGSVAEEALGEAEAVASDARRLRKERQIKRRIAEIEAFRKEVRARQIARLQAFANSTLLPDWMVADRMMAMNDEEQQLRAELERLEQPVPPTS